VDEGSAGTVRVSGSGRGSRGPTLVGATLVAFLLIAMLKPWAVDQPDGDSVPTEPPAASAVALALPSAPPPTPALPPDPNGMACLTDRPTQVLTLQRSTAGEVRSWVVVADGSLDPNDPTVSPVLLYSRRFVGIGICRGQPEGAGGSVIQRATIVDVRVVRGTRGTSTTVDLGAPTAITIRLDAPDSAILFGPPADASALGTPGPAQIGGPRAAVWSPGTYLFGYTLSGEQSSTVSWLRVEVRDTQGVS